MHHTLVSILEAKKRKGIHTTRSDATVLEAVDEMCRVHVGALLVMLGDTPVGILSERDVMRRVILRRLDPEKTQVGATMTKDVVCITSDASPEQAMAVMTQRRCRHLPVVLGGRIIGMVSIGDLVRWASRDHDYEIQMLEAHLAGKYAG
jgi:CBS domain-containing protein